MARAAGESPRTARYLKLSPTGTDDPVILCCEVSGEGPWVILVPGLGDTVWVWRRLIPFLEASHRVAAVEPRGHGRSASPRGPYTLEETGEDLARLAAALGAHRPVLIGHGLGARTSLWLAAERPELAAALVLIGADPAPPAGEAREALLRRMALAAGGDMQAAYKARKAEGGEPRGMSPKERAERHRLFLRNSPAGYAAALSADLTAPDLTERLGRVRCPVLAVAGERDEGRRAAAQRLAEGIPACEAVVIEGAGGFPQLDRPEALRALLEEFFRRHNLSVVKTERSPR